MAGSRSARVPYSVQMSDDTSPRMSSGTVRELAELRRQVESLRAENTRLLKLLDMTSQEARFELGADGVVRARPRTSRRRLTSTGQGGVLRSLFGARTDVYAVRWENARTGRAGWMPAVAGGWRKGSRAADQTYLPLTPEVLTAHLTGVVHIGLYPLLEGDRCCWLAADFDGPGAMLDALAYLKAARAVGAPAALEVSRSGVGAHVWVFFTDPVPAAAARQLGTGLVREAIGLRGRMDLGCYDRLFPSQNALAVGGIGNLIAAPLHGKSRWDGATVFLDLATLEPHEDQWAYLSTLDRLTPRQVARLAREVGAPRVGLAVDRLETPRSTRTRPKPTAIVHARLAARLTIDAAELTPALLATLKHAASMPNPEFYDRQQRRVSTWNIPRFLRSYDETLDGGLILPRGMLGTVEALVKEAGSRYRADRRTRDWRTTRSRVHRHPQSRPASSLRRADAP